VCAALVPVCFVLCAHVGGIVPENASDGILEATQHNGDTLQQLLERYPLRRPPDLRGWFCGTLA